VLDLKIGLLYDCYGGLLTDKQKDVMHLYYEDDYSLAEIAEELQVSRQAVHDMIKKSRRTLEDCEEKLGLAAKISMIDDTMDRIKDITDEMKASAEADLSVDRDKLLSAIDKINKLISEIE